MAARMPAAIIDLEEEREYVNGLIYADPGVGKTRLMGTAPNALFLSTETGTFTATQVPKTGLRKLWKIREWDDFVESYRWLDEQAGKADDFPFEHIIVDSLTDAQEKLQRKIGDRNHRLNPDKVRQDILGLDGYLESQNKLKKFVDQLNDLPCHVWYLAIRMDGEDGRTMPFLTSREDKLARNICSKVNLVGMYRLDDTGNNRDLYLQPTEEVFAKNQFDATGSIKTIRNPTIPGLVKRIGADGAPAAPAAQSAVRKAAPVRRPVRKVTK